MDKESLLQPESDCLETVEENILSLDICDEKDCLEPAKEKVLSIDICDEKDCLEPAKDKVLSLDICDEKDCLGSKEEKMLSFDICDEKYFFQPSKSSLNDNHSQHTRNKSVQWADWEMKNVVEFSGTKDTELLIDEYSQTEIEPYQQHGVLPLIDSLVQTSMEIGSIASRSRSTSLNTCTTIEEDEEKQAALSDLITHLEDTAALLRDYLNPPEASSRSDDYTKNEQTLFLLKYQIVIIVFTQSVSILILTLFDHLTFDHVTKTIRDTGYHVLTIACGSILQLLNMLLVIFATTVLSKQMLKYKVEGKLMAQTYLATVITFAGLYFIIFRIDNKSWEVGGADRIEDNIAVGQFIKMLYLSVSAATLCGAANIQPNYWHVTLILCFQSLINFVYFASILAQTIGNYHSYTVQVRRTSSISRVRMK